MSHLLTPAQAKAAVQPPEDHVFDCCICMGDGAFCLSTKCHGSERHFFCADCIVGTLQATVETSQFPAHCPSCRAECQDPAKLDAPVNDEVLSFLELRGLISRELVFRFSKARDIALGKATREKPPYQLCPANCGQFLLANHPSYTDTLLYETVLGGLMTESKGARLGQCPCGALICPHCDQLVPPDEERSHMCGEANAALGADKMKDNIEAAKKLVPKDRHTSEELKMLRKFGKECPACGSFIQKAEGCHIMQCGGFGAHKDMKTCLRAGGCGHEFDWNSMRPLRFGKPGAPANERQVRFRSQYGWGDSLVSRTMLAPGSVVALHCKAHKRFLRLTNDSVLGSPPKAFNELPGTWMDDRFIVVGLSSSSIALWSPMHERFVRVDGNEVNAKGGVKGVDKLPWHWTKERFTAVDVGDGELGLHSEAGGCFLVMEANGRVHAGGPKVAWNKLQPAQKADVRLRFRPKVIA